MKALASINPGGPETLSLTDLPDPTPGAGEVVIRVRACGVNFPDTLIIEDKYQFRPLRPFAPGGEVSGEIEALGEGVSGLAVGDRVMALTIYGGMSEKALAKAANCVKMPVGMSFEDGSAFLLTYGTAHYALQDRAHLAAGESILILGAAGGVGIATVQIAKAMGAHVVAGVSSAEKAKFTQSQGAERAVVYGQGPFDTAATKALTEQFKQAAGAKGFDVIYDIVGGAYAEPAIRSIAWDGRFLVVGFPAGIPKLPLNLVLLKSCNVIGVFLGAFAERDPATTRTHFDALCDLYAKGKLKPVISERFPLAQGGEAIRALSDRRALGKIIVTI